MMMVGGICEFVSVGNPLLRTDYVNTLTVSFAQRQYTTGIRAAVINSSIISTATVIRVEGAT